MAATSPATALPAPVFRHILAFAGFGGSDTFEEPPMWQVELDCMSAFQLVAKDWAPHVRELLADLQLRSLLLAFDTTTRAELERHKRRVTLHGRYVRDLTISMGMHDDDLFFARPGLHFVDETPLPWREVFARLPALERLDILDMPLSSPHVAAILDAASTYCLNLKALLLPGDDGRSNGASEASVASVYAAMARWHARGGLRHLSFPNRFSDDRYLQNTNYIENVTELCPAIECFDGYRESLQTVSRLTCTDKWVISKATWEKFNATCVRLKEFSWIVAPFKDDFFRVFGAHRKPALTSLTFAVNMLWDWDQYFFDVGAAERGPRSPYGFHATDPQAALVACPALRELIVCFYHPLEDDILDNLPVLFAEEDVDFLMRHFPQHEVFNADVFGDPFCIALAKHCPLLERLTMREVVERFNRNLVPIHRFTDRSLVALSRLEWLQCIELRSVNCSERGIFALLNDFPRTFGGQRDIQISLGGATAGSQLGFYHTVSKLLELILKSNDVRFASRRVVLRLCNATLQPVDPDWSKSYLRKLEANIGEVMHKYPALEIRCGTDGPKNRGFSRILEFGLFTRSATPHKSYGWDSGASADVRRAQALVGPRAGHAYNMDVQHFRIDGDVDDDFEARTEYDAYLDYIQHGGFFDGDCDYDDYDDYDDFGYGNDDQLYY